VRSTPKNAPMRVSAPAFQGRVRDERRAADHREDLSADQDRPLPHASDRPQRRELDQLGERLERALQSDPQLRRAESDQGERRELVGEDILVGHPGRMAEHRESPAASAELRVERRRSGRRRIGRRCLRHGGGSTLAVSTERLARKTRPEGKHAHPTLTPGSGPL
jgi:hypothetical protein